VLFMFLGKPLFHYLSITDNDFRIAGGIILLVLAILDLLIPGKPAVHEQQMVGIVPLAMPLIAGPAALTTVLVLAGSFGFSWTALSLGVNFLILLTVLTSAEKISRLLGMNTLQAFSKLPERELASFMEDRNISFDEPNWEFRLDDRGQTALINALYTAAWAFETTKVKQDWFCLSQTGRVMLGLEPAPPAPPEVKDFKVLPDRSVLAGIDLNAKTLAVLFRHCRTKRIDRILEFCVDAPALKEMPSMASPGLELLNVLKPCAPLPATVLDILEDRVPARGGLVLFRSCRGLIKIENPELLSLIRTHPRLKGYLDSRAPAGYLIIKDGADPRRFIERCQQHGFEVKPF